MASILLVDDDQYYRRALRGTLQKFGHQLSEAEDGQQAQALLNSQKFDLVISDIQMPIMSGIQLLQWIKDHHRIPVILITGFSELIETKNAVDLGADDFLLKPFKSDDIEFSVTRALNSPDETASPEQAADLDNGFCRIPLEDFISGSKVNFNIYLRISNSRYLKVAYRGEDLSLDRIEQYKSRGMRYLYLTREDFAKYVNFNLTIAKRIGAASQISREKKRNFLRHSAEVVLEQVFLDGVDSQAFDAAKDFSMTTLEILQGNDEAFSLLEALNSHANFLYAHSLGVSVYSVMVAKEIGWKSTPNLFKISLAGMLHDVGLKEVDPIILGKSRTEMSYADRMLFETHASRGMQLLNQVKSLPDDVVLIAYQHHEDCSGLGYPQKLSKSKIHPLARLIGLVDTFCDYTIQTPNTEKKTAREAIQQIALFQEKAFDPEMFSALKRIFVNPT